MKRFVIIVFSVAGMLFGGCASRVVPTDHYEDKKYVVVQKANVGQYLDEVFRRIREREPSTHWSVVESKPDAIRIRCAWRKNSFDINLVLKEKTYNVEYVCSQNLHANADGSRMYYAYNKLVKYFMEELFDVNHGRYTDPLHKATRSSFMGGDYLREHNPQTVGDVMRSINSQNARAGTAVDGVTISSERNVTCPHCGKVIDQGMRFCPECGKPLVKTCPKCGKLVRGRFCGDCGTKVESNAGGKE